MLVYRLTVHQQKYLYFREDIQYRLGFTQEVLRFMLDWSHSISKGQTFFKDLLNVSGVFAHINVKLLLRNRIL